MPLDIKQRVSDFLHQARCHESFEIPLFPLKTVLFPGGKLSLKIFEPRYMEMVSACLRDKKPFGVCLIRDGEETGKPAPHADTGCAAEITDWGMQQGVLNIQALGLQRFHIEDVRIEPNGLIVARAAHIASEPPQPLPAGHKACATLLRRLIEHLGVERFMPPLNYDDAVWVSYRLAELLPLKLSVRQNMLEMNDSKVRIEILHSFLAQQGLLA
ncbi:MAG: peptidase S16 [Nitrosomonadales bacterium]|nr:MAG: peptidase S16 [Nitrosomonadales bacterium]